MKSLIEYINESNNINRQEHGFDYVDLGLPSGTMWATCNVGAETPEDEGLLFQFGSVDGYEYGDNNNQFRTSKQNKQDTNSEDIPVTSSGKTYKTGETLDLKDDAAHVNMGGKWRMPTNDEIKELFKNTTYESKKINGVKGMMFTSNINGRQMFIPFIQGCWYDGNWEDCTCAYAWSSQVHASDVNDAYYIYCNSLGCASTGNFGSRSHAYSVRGVFKK